MLVCSSGNDHFEPFVVSFLQNSMRAVMEHKGPSATDFPKIKVLITKGQQDLTIRVSHVFVFLYGSGNFFDCVSHNAKMTNGMTSWE